MSKTVGFRWVIILTMALLGACDNIPRGQHVFRANNAADGGIEKPLEWVINAPAEFQILTIGNNGDPKGYFSARYGVFYNTVSGDLKIIPPPHQRKFSSLSWEPVYFRITNEVMRIPPTARHLSADVSMLEADYHRELYRQKTLEKCNSASCRVYLSYFGWKVHVSVPKGQIENHKLYCALMVQLFSTWTVRIDSALQPQDPPTEP